MTNKLDYGKAILEINPDAHFSISGNDYSTIEWVGDTAPIAEADVKAKAEEMATRDAYIAPRQRAYPSIEDQLDMQYHDAVNGTTTWKDAIQAVKDANPKPTE